MIDNKKIKEAIRKAGWGNDSKILGLTVTEIYEVMEDAGRPQDVDTVEEFINDALDGSIDHMGAIPFPHMRILVACENSGTVRKAFRSLGHDARSCDILPAEEKSPFHIQENVLNVLGQGWDLMVGHPPCTHIAVSGARYFAAKRADGRQQEGIDFFMALANAPIRHKAIENPVCIMSSVWRKPDQVIQPWQYGHPESKATCLWLENLPKLEPTKIMDKPDCGYWENQTPSGQNKLGPSKDRWKKRSKTYEGIAQAMAIQWSFL